ncbi:MAG: glycosyltransferase family 4 protein [Thermoplasmata archaeon]|nr:glycosyltransferase family 4 protein [Thermoplasmata archaeon]
MGRWRIDLLATEPAEATASGLSRAVWELAAALVDRGHAVRVLFPADEPAERPAHRGVTAVAVPTIGTSRRPFGRDIAIGKNASELLDPSADLVIGNDEKAGALTLPKGAGGRKPVFAMLVHDVALHTFETLRPLEPDRGWRQKVGNFLDRRTLRRLETTALNRARLVIVASELNRELLRKYYDVPPARVALLPHGVPDPLDVGTKDEARAALKLPRDVPVVVFIGRNPERQGRDIALEAYRRIRVFFPGARCLVLGSTVKVEPGVSSLGVVDEATKARALKAADVFLFPARYEGFGLAPREAMRYGVATVVSRNVPFDGAKPGETVRVVTDEDPGAYASELAELLADPALRRRVGEAGRLYADDYSYAKMAERFEGLFVPILGAPT